MTGAQGDRQLHGDASEPSFARWMARKEGQHGWIHVAGAGAGPFRRPGFACFRQPVTMGGLMREGLVGVMEG